MVRLDIQVAKEFCTKDTHVQERGYWTEMQKTERQKKQTNNTRALKKHECRSKRGLSQTGGRDTATVRSVLDMSSGLFVRVTGTHRNSEPQGCGLTRPQQAEHREGFGVGTRKTSGL